jgi:hypothetical protein
MDEKKPLTNAQRQARWRERHQGEHPQPVIHYRQPKRRRSRPERWRAAVKELRQLQDEYQEWLENLPENLQDSEVADRLREICEVELDGLEIDQLPQGFGRD